MNNPTNQLFKQWIEMFSNPLIITILSAATYIGIYASQAAFIGYYGLDNESVKIDINYAAQFGLGFLFSVAIVSFLAIPVIQFAFSASKQDDQQASGPIRFVLLLFLEYLLLVMGYIIIKQILDGDMVAATMDLSEFTLPTLLVFLLIPAVPYLFALFERGQGKSKKELATEFVDKRSKHILYYIFALVLSSTILIAVTAGERMAANKNTYKYITPDEVVVLERSDLLIVAEVKSGRISGKYRYVKVGDKPIAFQTKKGKIKGSFNYTDGEQR